MTRSGIYAIENTKNGKLYVGSSVDVHKRWVQHKSSLRKGLHHSIALQRAWNKYGCDCFHFKVLEYCDDLVGREQHYIDSLNSAYNVLPLAYRSSGRVMKKKSINKILRTKQCAMLSLDKEGGVLKRFISVQSAAKYYNISISAIGHAIRYKRLCKIGVGFTHERKGTYVPRVAFPKRETKRKIMNHKPIYLFDIFGRLITKLPSRREAASLLHADPGNITTRVNKHLAFSFGKTPLSKFLLADTPTEFGERYERHLKIREQLLGEGELQVYDLYGSYLGRTTEGLVKSVLGRNVFTILRFSKSKQRHGYVIKGI
jgi:hypothetical protein